MSAPVPTLEDRQAYQREERAAIAELDPELAEVLAGEAPCRLCGCSDSLACPEVCGWAEPDLCTACAEDLAT